MHCRRVQSGVFAVSRTPDQIDMHVAARLRLRRTMLGVSQEALAARIGVTFQQIQKYEKGQNRVGASRLYQLAAALESPVEFFFEGLNGAAGLDADDETSKAALAMLSTPEGVQLHLAFSRIASANTRRRIVDLLAALTTEAA